MTLNKQMQSNQNSIYLFIVLINIGQLMRLVKLMCVDMHVNV